MNDGSAIILETLLPAYTTGNQSYPAIAALPNEGFVILWTSYNQVTTTSLDDIYACVFDSVPVKVKCDFLVNETTTRSQSKPRVAALTNGFVVTWETNQSGNYDIYARTFDQLGNAIASEFKVNSNAGRSHNCPDVAQITSTNNLYVITWHSDFRNGAVDATDFDIYFKIYSSTGQIVTDTIVNTTLLINNKILELAAYPMETS
jgi:hypothetical protein